MSHLRFQHVFLALMSLSVISAFAIPPRYAFHPGVSLLFAPVSQPTRKLAAWAYRRLGGDRPTDHRDADAIRTENEDLKNSLSRMSIEIQELERRAAEREKLGAIRDLCTFVSVVGADSGTRQSLSLRSSSLEGISSGQSVLYGGGVVGQVQSSGLGGAQIRLLTDPGFRVRGTFGVFRRRPDNLLEFAKLPAPAALVEGEGHDRMVVRGLSNDQVKEGKIAVGNWVVLADPDWPAVLQGQRLGIVTRIAPRPEATLFAEITVEPKDNLSRLREVMVLTKERG